MFFLEKWLGRRICASLNSYKTVNFESYGLINVDKNSSSGILTNNVFYYVMNNYNDIDKTTTRSNNPQTYDNIIYYVISLIISTIGIGVVVYKKLNYNK